MCVNPRLPQRLSKKKKKKKRFWRKLQIKNNHSTSQEIRYKKKKNKMGEDGNPKAVLAEILKHEPGSRSRGALIYKLKERINEDADFAEELVDEKGILQLLDMMGDGTGSDVGYLLEAVCCLLLYLNAMQQLATQPDIVDRIWRCATSVDESGCARIRVSKPAIQTLIVTVKHLGSLNQEDNHLLRDSSDKSDAGRQVVHRSVKRLMREKEGLNCYKSLINLLSTPETHLQTNVLGLLNILLSKAVTASKLKAKKLLFLWSQCGLIDKVKSMQSEDPTLKRLLATFDKRLGTIKVPGCWLEATKLKGKFDQEKKAYDKVSNEVFMFEQQQGRVRHAKVNITKYQETMRSISLQMGLSPNYHPAKRFSEGGGIPIPTKTQQLPSKPVNIGAIPSDAGLVDIRNKLFQVYMSAPDFMSHVEKIVGPIARPEGDGGVSNVRSKKGVKKGTGSGDLDSESDEDDDVPPSDEDEDDVLPPSDEEPPSSDDDLPPSSSEESDSDSDSDDSDDVLPPADQPPPLPADASPEQQLIHQQQQAIYENSVQQAAAAAGGGVPPPADAGAGAPAGGAPPPGVAGGAPAPPPPGTAVAPPPPTAGGAPAPPAAPGGPPPPPGTAKKRMPAPPRKAAAAAPTIEWWKGGKSAIPLRVFHWEKATVDGPMATGTIWNKVHHQIDCSFDKEDFVAKFQTKPKKTGGSKKVEEKRIEMMDAKKFQNVSIMLHKMPAIDDIKKAIDNLDSELLNRDCLEAIKAQIPNEDEEDMFVSKIDEKNAKGEDWEKPELYMKMIHEYVFLELAQCLSSAAAVLFNINNNFQHLPNSYNSGNFKKRAETWLFSQDWGEITMNFTKPLLKLRTAIDAVTACEELPYIMGMLLVVSFFFLIKI